MKKTITFLTLFAIFCLSNTSNAQITSTANGNWTNPLTWGGTTVPTPGSIVIINHIVTLDIDYGYSSGSITINNTGAINSTVPMRGIVISGGTFTNSGTFSIPRVALFGGTIVNNGAFDNDSLLVQTTLTNNSSGNINATQFMINTGGAYTNYGTTVSANFLNKETTTNYLSMTSNDLLNSKIFNNEAAGTIIIANNFLNSDGSSNTALFKNDGKVKVNNDWRNTDQISGSGKFCVQNNTKNEGNMTGTFDFCDQTGGNIDLNTGTTAGTITYCNFSCNWGINDDVNVSEINPYPNPSNGVFTFNIKSDKLEIEIYDIIGSRIYYSNISSQKSEIDLSKQAKGIYFYQIKNEKAIINSGKIVIE